MRDMCAPRSSTSFHTHSRGPEHESILWVSARVCEICTRTYGSVSPEMSPPSSAPSVFGRLTALRTRTSTFPPALVPRWTTLLSDLRLASDGVWYRSSGS